MTRDYRIRLEGQRSAPGEILAADAILLITAFKDLTYRLTRMVAERAGLGRTDAPLEALAQVRLGLRADTFATELDFHVGDEAALGISDPISRAVDAAFWSVADGIRTNRRPDALTEASAGAAGALASGLVRAAVRAAVTVPGHGEVRLATRLIRTDVWHRSPAAVAEASVHGTLEMVDLHNGHFRLRDRNGAAVEMIDVTDAVTASRLVGAPVVATGLLATAEGQRPRMERPRLSRAAPMGISA